MSRLFPGLDVDLLPGGRIRRTRRLSNVSGDAAVSGGRGDDAVLVGLDVYPGRASISSGSEGGGHELSARH